MQSLQRTRDDDGLHHCTLVSISSRSLACKVVRTLAARDGSLASTLAASSLRGELAARSWMGWTQRRTVDSIFVDVLDLEAQDSVDVLNLEAQDSVVENRQLKQRSSCSKRVSRQQTRECKTAK